MAPVAGRGTQLPALQHVLFQVKDNTLHLTTTDLEVGVHTVVGGKMEVEGAVTVPARSVLDYVGQLPKTHPLTVELKKNGVEIATKGFRASFAVGDADEFPLLPEGSRAEAVEVSGMVLTGALSRVLFAAAREETRPEIRSVYCRAEGRELRLAATDSFRLAEEVVALPNGSDFELLLPLSAATEVVRLFSEQKTISLNPHANHVLLYGEGVELSSRLIDGRYPDYRQIIPESWKTRLFVRRHELVRALKTLLVFLSRDSRRVEVVMNPKMGVLEARVAGSEAGQGEVTVQCEGEGEKLTVLVNIQYLLEGLQHIDIETCVIECGGPQDPIVFRPEERQGYVYVVMPIQAE